MSNNWRILSIFPSGSLISILIESNSIPKNVTIFEGGETLFHEIWNTKYRNKPIIQDWVYTLVSSDGEMPRKSSK